MGRKWPTPAVIVEDEGVDLGIVERLSFTGAGVTATVAGNEATVTVAAGGGGVTAIEFFLDFGTRAVTF